MRNNKNKLFEKLTLVFYTVNRCFLGNSLKNNKKKCQMVHKWFKLYFDNGSQTVHFTAAFKASISYEYHCIAVLKCDLIIKKWFTNGTQMVHYRFNRLV